MDTSISEQCSDADSQNRSPNKKVGRPRKTITDTVKKLKPKKCSDSIQTSENKEVEFSKSPKKDFSVKNHLNNSKKGETEFELNKDKDISDSSKPEPVKRKSERSRKQDDKTRIYEKIDYSDQQTMEDANRFEIDKSEKEKVDEKNFNSEVVKNSKTNDDKPEELLNGGTKLEISYKGNEESNIPIKSSNEVHSGNISEEKDTPNSKSADNQDDVIENIQANISDVEKHDIIITENNEKESHYSKSGVNDMPSRKSNRLLTKSENISDDMAENEVSHGELTIKINSPNIEKNRASITKKISLDVKDTQTPVKRGRGRPPKLKESLTGSLPPLKSPENSKPLEINKKRKDKTYANSKKLGNCCNGLVRSPNTKNSFKGSSDFTERTSAVQIEKGKNIHENRSESIENNEPSNDKKKLDNSEDAPETNFEVVTENEHKDKQICLSEELSTKNSSNTQVDKKDFEFFTKTERTLDAVHKYDKELQNYKKIIDIDLKESKVTREEGCEIKNDDREITTNSKIPDGVFTANNDSKVHPEDENEKNGKMGYLDFGYDINRRTSFRKILEKVMEASRLEMEMTKSETLRSQRCKSVPNDGFGPIKSDSAIHVKAYSADAKLKFLKEKGNSLLNMRNIDVSKVTKRLDYDVETSFKNNFSIRKRTRSMHAKPVKHQDSVNDKSASVNSKQSAENKTDSTCNGPRTENEINTKADSESKNEVSSGTTTCENACTSEREETFSVDSEMSIEDLEVENLTSLRKNGEFAERPISRCVSEGGRKRKLSQRSASVRSKRVKNESDAEGNGRADTPYRTVKKVGDFKLGDIVWSKIGAYPYWPGMIVEDPETSEFKRFRLLRSTPYYHVRFFGDKGKRAWTIHCILYEGPDDLTILKEECQMKGHSGGEYSVKHIYKEKWNRAVTEAEMIKDDPLEKKLSFFEQILERCKTPINTENVKSKVQVVAKPSLVRSKSLNNINQREINRSSFNSKGEVAKIPMKISSIEACIADVVEKYSEKSTESIKDAPSTPPLQKSMEDVPNGNVKENSTENVEKTNDPSKNSSHRSLSRRRSVSMKDIPVISCKDSKETEYSSTDSTIESTERKTKQSEEKIIENDEIDSSTDICFELLEISMPDLETKSQESAENQKSPPTQIKVNTTPTSSRKDAEVSVSRSRSSLRLEKRRLSREYSQDERPKEEGTKESAEESCSPRRMRSKRRTIGACQNIEDSPKNQEFLNECISRLPEYKKNIFRGVPKERVCQICEKPGEVVKCRGPCNGDFHVDCIEKSLKETEKSTLKETELVLNVEPSTVSLEDDLFIDNKQVEISTVVSRKPFTGNVNLSPFNRKIPLLEQFDRKMKEMMNQVESGISADSNESSSEETDVSDKSKTLKSNKGKGTNKRVSTFKHVTADDVAEIVLFDSSNSKSRSESLELGSNVDEGVYKCSYCVSSLIPPCFVCNSVVSKKGNEMRQRCSQQKCGKYYHLECLNVWHQTQWSFILHDKKKTEAFDSFVCPRHSCHICTSENSGFSMGRCPNDKLVKCLRCPATYHNSYHCVPAGTEILTTSQIVCPRHVEGNKKTNTLNTIWCFVCSEGGNLICCETCPTSVHAECLPVNLLDDDTYICEDCESGRFPLYDEVVWVKCGTFRWWPAVILFPSEVPPNVESKPHSKGEFVVKFFGTYNYFWVGRGRTFLYQEGDTGCLNSNRNKIDEAFSRALREAADVYSFKRGLRAKKQKEVNNGLKPPPYVRIKVNRPVGNVKVFEGNLSNTTPCDCDPKDKSPCGPNSNCLNRILLTECNPEICPAGQRCKNQCFEKREYPQLVPYRTASRGWGLKTLEPIKKGRFVIEYVGEIIDDDEYQRRITRMHQQKDENYYFLTIDKDRMLDAGPKGNVARFMNHSCQPNCETQKWTVNGDTRVGLFAIEDIAADSELTFNYNLECVGTEKKICRCGAPNCSGFIGVKPSSSEDQKPVKKNNSSRIVESEKLDDAADKETCFICGKNGDLGSCSNKLCLRSYHLECVQLDSWPNGKWICPSHACNICSKRTSRICVHCNNSYCPFHSDGKIRYDDTLGFLCSEHEQTKRRRKKRKHSFNESLESTSTSEPGTSQENEVSEGAKFASSRSERYRKRTSCVEDDTPSKRRKLEK